MIPAPTAEGSGTRSKSVTRWPSRARNSAAAPPAVPRPITATSSEAGMRARFRRNEVGVSSGSTLLGVEGFHDDAGGIEQKPVVAALEEAGEAELSQLRQRDVDAVRGRGPRDALAGPAGL